MTMQHAHDAPFTKWRSLRCQCSLFFVGAGLGIGGWAASLPTLGRQLGLDKASLGTILLFFALGAIPAMVAVGRMGALMSARSLAVIGAGVFGTMLVALPHAPGMAWFATGVLVAGVGFGTLDVAMNVEASRVESRTGLHLMSTFHALFSVGNLLGAFLAGVVQSKGGALETCLGAAGITVLVVSAATAVPGLMRSDAEPPRHAAAAEVAASARPSGRGYLFTLCAIGFLAFFAEGGMMDWTAVYLVSGLGQAESVGAYGFAVFAGTMAAGRFIGDAMIERFGSKRLLQGGALLSAVSVFAIVASESVLLAFPALILCGLGVSNIIPTVFAEAGRLGGAAAGRTMSLVTTMGYSGLLLGPPLLGLIAQASTLQASFLVLVVAFLFIAALQLSGRREVGVSEL